MISFDNMYTKNYVCARFLLILSKFIISLKLIAKFFLGSVGPDHIVSVYFHGITCLSQCSTDDSEFDKE